MFRRKYDMIVKESEALDVVEILSRNDIRFRMSKVLTGMNGGPSRHFRVFTSQKRVMKLLFPNKTVKK